MLLLQRLRAWLARRQKPPQVDDPVISDKAHRDMGVQVTRVRLPSGKEVTIVKRHKRGE